jgi:hypothetical protein
MQCHGAQRFNSLHCPKLRQCSSSVERPIRIVTCTMPLYFVTTLNFSRFAHVAFLSDRRHFVKHAAGSRPQQPVSFDSSETTGWDDSHGWPKYIRHGKARLLAESISDGSFIESYFQNCNIVYARLCTSIVHAASLAS